METIRDFTYVIANYKPQYWHFSARTWVNIVSHIAQTQTIEAIIKQINDNSNYSSDLSQDMYLSLLTHKQPDKLKAIFVKGDIKFYLTRIVLTQIKSSSSETWHRYRKGLSKTHITQSDMRTYPDEQSYLFENLIQQITEDNVIDTLKEPISNLISSAITECSKDWYVQAIANKYLIEGQTLSCISKQTKIPLSSIFKTINVLRPKLKDWITNYIEQET